jgi:hypothetical protein
MPDGIMLTPGGGEHIQGGGVDVSVKTVMPDGAFAATFEVVVPPGYDVGTHIHTDGRNLLRRHRP